VGLYDLPFSRDALTSDSKLLFMDRSLIKDELTRYGYADNTVGLMLHGRPHCGRYEWMIGVFDNIEFEEFSNDPARHSDQLMPAGRFVVNLLDPAEPPQGYADYKASYLGKGHRLALGINGAVLNEAIEDDENSDVFAWGVDVFYNYGRWVAQAEYDWLAQDFFGEVDDDVQPEGWYAQAGYMLTACWELAGRYQVLDPDTNTFQDQLRWTSIGLNYYIWDHNLKIQTEYQFRDGQDDDERDNAVHCQLQLDY
jgi:phosphate-selective porin